MKEKVNIIIKQGFDNTLKVIWKITKIIIPVYILVSLLAYLNILPIISNYLAPIMSIFGLPGEACLALILGNFINIYAAIATLITVNLSVKQITIIALMLTTSHSLFIETSVLASLKVSKIFQVVLRLTVMIIIGIVMNLIWRG